MFFSQRWSRNRICPPGRGRSDGRTCHGKGLTGNFLLISAAISLVILTTGCATPKVQPADPQLVFKSDLLGFLQDGVTTREEVVLKLGIPSAQMEVERILMYQMRVDKDGKWHLVAKRWKAATGLRAWSEGTMSLVLVFGENGVLRKHSLVTAQ
jgi:hypothetical protein